MFFVFVYVKDMKKSQEENAEKAELPNKEELNKMTEEEFQQLLKDVKKRKYKKLQLFNK